MPPDLSELCRCINTLAAWLALDDCGPDGPAQADLDRLDLIVLLGNQCIPTLTAACRLARRAPRAKLLFSGGVGHSTHLLVGNLRRSERASFLPPELLAEPTAEADLFAAVAQQAFDLPAARILIERESANTAENARFSLRALAAAGVLQENVLLLQDPTMQRRSVITWLHLAQQSEIHTRLLSHAAFVPRVEPSTDGQIQLCAGPGRQSWTQSRFLGLLAGEIERLRDDEHGYGPRGKNFLPHGEIPAEILAAYRAISHSGHAFPAER